MANQAPFGVELDQALNTVCEAFHRHMGRMSRHMFNAALSPFSPEVREAALVTLEGACLRVKHQHRGIQGGGDMMQFDPECEMKMRRHREEFARAQTLAAMRAARENVAAAKTLARIEATPMQIRLSRRSA